MKKRTFLARVQPHALHLFLVTLVALVVCACSSSQESLAGSTGSDSDLVDIEGLGALSFPNSGAQVAQDAFLRGLLLLHSFEYDSAASYFQEAQRLDPDFAMAYWGEAMTYNHPLWRHHGRESALEALNRLGPTREARREKAKTEREKEYMDVVENLYASELSADAFSARSKLQRDREYMEDLEGLNRAYPDDDEARAFYALSILGSLDGSRDFAVYMRAAATAQPVFERNPRHPGAAHYLIHSFDDPVHAPLGLPAANIYAEVAPNAAHAQHMTSHIFVAMGLWERVVDANIRARDTQDAQLVDSGTKPGVCGIAPSSQDAELEEIKNRPNYCGHYSTWLLYGHLQLGEVAEAEELMDLCYSRVQDSPNSGEWIYFANMRSRLIVDSENWEWWTRWTMDKDDLPAEQAWGEGYPAARLTYRVTDALATLQLGDDTLARALVSEARPADPMAALQIDQLAGLLAIRRGETDEGLGLLRQAAETETSLPFQFGPPVAVKPGYELLGEVLASSGEKKTALEAFRVALERTPGRARSTEGLEASSGAGAPSL